MFSVCLFFVLKELQQKQKPPLVRGDSPQCGEMSQRDKGDGRRQRVSAFRPAEG